MSAALEEWPLAASVATTMLFLLLGQQWLADLSNPFWFTLMLLWPLAAILLSAFALTIPAVLTIGFITGKTIVLGRIRWASCCWGCRCWSAS